MPGFIQITPYQSHCIQYNIQRRLKIQRSDLDNHFATMGSIGLSNGDHQILPNRSSSEIYLDIGTPDELNAQQEVNSTEWRGALSLEQYLRREVHLSEQDLTKNGGLTGWVLVHQPNGSSKRQVLCGCETIRKRALVRDNGKVKEVIAHAVGSVFCPPQHRGKGYAGRMMSDLGKRLKSWQMDNGKHVLFSVLFSDIGKKFYARAGWQTFPSAHVSLLPTESPGKDLSAVQMLKSEDLQELCTIDELLIRTRLSKSSGADKPAVALVPDTAALRWHHAREEFVAKELFNQCPTIKGAVSGDVGSRVWCFWTRVWTNPQEDDPNTLHILRLVVEDEGFSDFGPASSGDAAKMKDSPTARAIAAIFAAAQAEAAQWGMKEIQIWNPTSTTLAAAQILDAKAAVEYREEESITCLQWYGEGSWENVDWVCNEKYGWC